MIWVCKGKYVSMVEDSVDLKNLTLSFDKVWNLFENNKELTEVLNHPKLWKQKGWWHKKRRLKRQQGRQWVYLMKMMIIKMWVRLCQMFNMPKHWWFFGLKINESDIESDNESPLFTASM